MMGLLAPRDRFHRERWREVWPILAPSQSLALIGIPNRYVLVFSLVLQRNPDRRRDVVPVTVTTLANYGRSAGRPGVLVRAS